MKTFQLSILGFLATAVVSTAASTLQFTNISVRINAPGNSLYGVAYGEGRFMAVGTNSRVLVGNFVPGQSFIDPQFWTINSATASGKKKLGLLSIAASSSNLFVLSGEGNRYFTTTDGTNFVDENRKIFSTRAAVSGLAFNGNTFVAVPKAPQIGFARSDGTAHVLRWAEAGSIVDLSYPESFRAVTPYRNGFAACGVFGVVRTSGNGNEWTLARNGGVGEPDLLGIASDGENTLVAVGKTGRSAVSGGVIISRPDTQNGGVKFSKTFDGKGFGPLSAVAFNGSEFVAVGRRGVILASTTTPNGRAWSKVAVTNLTQDLQGVAFATNGNLRGVGIVVGAKRSDGRATVLLVGEPPNAPVVITNATNVCAGEDRSMIVSITNSVGPGLVAVEWFDLDAGSSILHGTIKGDWRFELSNTLSEFTLRPVLTTGNLTDLNQPTTLRIGARAIDLRTGFTGTTTRLDRVIFPRPTSLVSGHTNICNGQPVSIRADLTGLGPWLVSWTSNGTVLAPVPSATRVALLNFTPINPELNTFSLHEFKVAALVDLGSALQCAANVLSNDLVGTAIVTNFPRPTALVSGSTNICNGEPVTIRAELTGIGPWQITWASNGFLLPALASSSPLALLGTTPSSPELNAPSLHEYRVAALVDLGSALQCVANVLSNDLRGTAIVTNFPRPTAVVSGTTNICNGDPVTVRADLTGIGPWQVTWASNGVALPAVFNAAPLALLEVAPISAELNGFSLHTFGVAALVDLGSALQCAANVLSNDLRGTAIVTNFPRPTAVVSGSTNICNDQPVTIRADLTGLGPWRVIWTSNDLALPAITNDTPLALLNVIPISPASNTYFLHEFRVAILVDLGSALQCAANVLSNDLRGTAIVTNFPRPTAVVSGSTNICNGQPALIQAELTGIGPWQITWASNDVVLPAQTVSGVERPFVAVRTETPISPEPNAVFLHHYRVVNLVDLGSAVNCPATLENLTGTATVTNYPRPTAVVSGNKTDCEGGVADVQAELTGIGPWQITWASNGVVLPPQTVPSGSSPVIHVRTETPASLDPNAVTLHRFTVTNLVDMGSALACAANSGSNDLRGSALVTVNPRPTSTIISGSTNFYNLPFKKNEHDKDFDITAVAQLTGVGPWKVTWSDGVTDPVEVTHNSSPASHEFTVKVFKATLPTNFTFSVIALSNSATTCQAGLSDLRSNAVASFNPLPAALVSGRTNLCADNLSDFEIEVDLSGRGPWTNIVWSDGFTNVLETNSFVRTIPVSYFSNLTSASSNYVFYITNLHDSFTNTANTNLDLLGVAQLTIYAVATNAPVSLGNITNCDNEVAELKVSVADGFTVDWFEDAGQTVLLLPGSTNLAINSDVGTNVYWAAVRSIDAPVRLCYFAVNTPVTNVVIPVPATGATSVGNVTSLTNIPVQLEVAVDAGLTVDWFADEARTLPILNGQGTTTVHDILASEAGATNYYAAVRYASASEPFCYFPINTIVTHVATNLPPTPPMLGSAASGTPVLGLTKSGTALSLQWTGDFVLQKCTDLATGKWVNVQSGTSGVMNTCTLPIPSAASSGSAFFRLVPGSSK